MNDTQSHPLVSIIIRTKDRPQLLEEALRSVADQTYPMIEAVVVNDGGVDVSQLVDSFNTRIPRLRHIALADNVGRAGAANQGLKAAGGEFIAFLDDDDLYYPDALTALTQELRESNAAVVYGRVVLKHFHSEGTPASDLPDRHFACPFDRTLLWVENYIPFNALLFRKEVFEQFGLLREDLPLGEDWEFLLRLSDHVSPVFIDHPVAIYRSFGDATVYGRRFTKEVLDETMDRIMQERWSRVTPAIIRAHQVLNVGRFEWRQRELLADIANLRHYLQDAEAQRNALTQEVDNLRHFLADLTQEAENLRRFLADAEAQRNALTQEVDNLRHFLEHSEAERQRLQQEVDWINTHKIVVLYLKVMRRLGW